MRLLFLFSLLLICLNLQSQVINEDLVNKHISYLSSDDLEGMKFGFDSNIQNGNNETDSYIATTTAYNKCLNSQGSHCDVPNNQISFKYCASMVYNKKPYFGYSNNKEISQTQAIKACEANNFYVEDENCENIITTVCNT